MSLLLVLPFCAKDGDLAIANLEWIAELDPSLPYHCILSHDDQTPPAMIQRMQEIAGRVFQKVETAFYPAPEKKYWPAAPNWAFQNIARYIAHFHPNCSWLFLEADATPIRKGWLQDIEAEHIKGGKPFTGHVVDGMGHINGSAIYPAMVAAYSQQAMTVEETAWDVVLGATLDKDLIHNAGQGEWNGHPARHLFQHCWNMREDNGEPTNGHGYSPTFKGPEDAVRKVDLNAAIYHRCKDGSLIKALREFYKNPSAVMVPKHIGHETRTDTSTISQTKNSESLGGTVDEQEKTTLLHENKTKEAAKVQAKPQAKEAHPRCEILIVTYFKDAPWLCWCLRSIRKHCTGFAGVTLVIPDRDAGAFKDAANEHAKSGSGIQLRIRMFREKPGKGMINHMAIMGHADDFVPKDTEFVMHVDADCIFHSPATPSDYIKNGKPIYIWRTYASLAEVREGQKVVSDCAQWKAPTEAQLGFETDAYTMCIIPSVLPLSFYKPYREHIEKVQGKPYLDYMLEGKNSFPQNRMDHTAMGAYAFKFMHGLIEWVDIGGGNHLAPKSFTKSFWSHGGITPEVQKELESFTT